MKLFRKEEGFTLVELMVVVLIIGILVAIAIPVFGAAKSNAQKKSCWANQRTIDGALNSYQAEYELFPPIADPMGDLVTQGYLKTAPTCPTNKVDYTFNADALGNADSVNGCPDTAVTGHGAYQ